MFFLFDQDTPAVLYWGMKGNGFELIIVVNSNSIKLQKCTYGSEEGVGRITNSMC